MERPEPWTKRQRMQHANVLIEAVSKHGRRFFHYGDRTARFEMGLDGRLWFRDEHTWKRCLTTYRWRWRWFSNGGTLRRLVDDLAHYVRCGKPMHRGHFGPWPSRVCDGDLWGYGHAAMNALRAEIHDNPCLQPVPQANTAEVA